MAGNIALLVAAAIVPSVISVWVFRRSIRALDQIEIKHLHETGRCPGCGRWLPCRNH